LMKNAQKDAEKRWNLYSQMAAMQYDTNKEE